MKVIELFAGIGGFRIACDRLGVETVFANDIKHGSCEVYRNRFDGDAMKEGDIALLIPEVPEHDLLTGGFPCQPFSAAGKKKGIGDPRGTLFMNIAEILNLRKPKFFVLENVARLVHMDDGKHFATILSTLCDCGYTVEWRILDAKDFGVPQTRKRIFFSGRKKGYSIPFLVSKREFSTGRLPEERKSIEEHDKAFPSWGIADGGMFFGGNPDRFEDAKPLVTLEEVLLQDVDAQYDLTDATLPRLAETTSVDRIIDGVHVIANQNGGARMGYTIFGTKGVAPTLTSSSSRHYERYFINGRYRRLTPEEYARIQGFPDDHCDSAKHADRYVMYGNAVPPDMAQWVIAKTIGKN